MLFRYLTEHCSWQLNQSSEAYQKNYGNEAYAALVMKKAACSGYAKAYIMLCEAANVPVRHVNANSWTHQWNESKSKRKVESRLMHMVESLQTQPEFENP